MVAIPSRHKSLVLLAGVILLQVLMLALQIKRDSEGRLIRVWTVGAVSPLSGQDPPGLAGFATPGATTSLCKYYAGNEQMRRENDALKLQIAQLQGRAAEADRLAPC